MVITPGGLAVSGSYDRPSQFTALEQVVRTHEPRKLLIIPANAAPVIVSRYLSLVAGIRSQARVENKWAEFPRFERVSLVLLDLCCIRDHALGRLNNVVLRT